MARHGAILDLGRPLANGYHIEDLPMTMPALCPFSLAHLAPGAQMRCQLLLEYPACLEEEAAIDRFMRYPHVWIARVLSPQPTRYLLRRPLKRQLLRYPPS
jgi:hypothetical protein